MQLTFYLSFHFMLAILKVLISPAITSASEVKLGGYTLVKAPQVQKLFPSYFLFAPLNVTTKFLTGRRTSHLKTTAR